MIKINKIPEFKCRIYDPSGKYIGKANYWQFNDLRIQIRKEKIFGYYCVFNNDKITIDSNGSCDKWPIGFYDLIDNQLNELIGL